MKNIELKKITVGDWSENTYLIICENDCVIVDPGDDFERINNEIVKLGLSPKAIINTHGHFDHIGAVHDFKVRYNIPFFMSKMDKRLLRQVNLYRKLAGSSNFVTIPQIDFDLYDGQKLDFFGGRLINVLSAPGHTKGSCCFYWDKDVLSGDIILSGELGRTDLKESNFEDLKQTLFTLNNKFENFTFYPGHGSKFKISEINIEKLIHDRN